MGAARSLEYAERDGLRKNPSRILFVARGGTGYIPLYPPRCLPTFPFPEIVVRCIAIITTLLVASAVHAEDPVIVTQKSGNWSEPGTWAGNNVPGAGARVLVKAGHRVLYDTKADAIVRGINVAGSLVFATDTDTVLNVGLIKIQDSEVYSEDGFECDHVASGEGHAGKAALVIGTPEKPVTQGKSARIRLHFVEGMDKESCPAIVCCGGRLDLHGQPLNRTWVKIGENVNPGDSAVSLAEPVQGWRIGDRIIITGTRTHGSAKEESTTEERIITAIAPDKLTVNEPLKMAHAGEGEYRGEVANLSRNVVIESADPAGVRGHTMYHKGSSGSVSYAEFRHLGKQNVLGKYALHFHLCRDTMRGSFVVGNSIWDSHNRWLTIHGTDYLVVRDNVGYKSIGHGYFLEDGTEVFNTLDRNLAVLATAGKKLPKQVLPFDQNNGAGFWWTCSLNSFTRNVAAECDRYGFRYEATPTSALKLNFSIRQSNGSRKMVDPRTLPFIRFEDNEVHSSHGLYGVNLGEGVNRVGPDEKHPFVVKNLKIWDVHYAFRPQVPNLHVENLHIHRVAYGVYHPNYDNHHYKNVLISQTNTEPFNRGHDDDSVQYGLLTVDGLTFDGCRSGGMPLIQISDHNPSGSAVSHFRNVKTMNWADSSKAKALVNLGGGPRPQPKSDKGVSIYLHDWFGSGRTAMVVSTKSGEFKANATNFRMEPLLTGNESRVTEIKDVPFPPTDPLVDDFPPATVITQILHVNGKVVVRGVSTDNGMLKGVTVNGQQATAKSANFADWEITLGAGTTKVEAVAVDVAGNIEQTPAVVMVK